MRSLLLVIISLIILSCVDGPKENADANGKDSLDKVRTHSQLSKLISEVECLTRPDEGRVELYIARVERRTKSTVFLDNVHIFLDSETNHFKIYMNGRWNGQNYSRTIATNRFDRAGDSIEIEDFGSIYYNGVNLVLDWREAVLHAALEPKDISIFKRDDDSFYKFLCE